MSKRLGILSDIHGNQYAWRSFLDKLPQLNLDELIFCGDIFGYYYGQAEIINSLNKLQNLTCILGNHDHYYLEMKAKRINPDYLSKRYGSTYLRQQSITVEHYEYLLSLKPEATLTRESLIIKIFHGGPSDYLEERLYPDKVKKMQLDADILISGHTHFRLYCQVGNLLLINPGSLGQPRDRNPAGFAVLTLPELKVEFINIDYDRSALANDIKRFDPGNEKLLELLSRSPNGNDYE